jgi:hypothetical protein
MIKSLLRFLVLIFMGKMHSYFVEAGRYRSSIDLSYIFGGLQIALICGLTETNQNHLVDRALIGEKLLYFRHGNFGCPVDRETKRTRTDSGKSNCADFVLLGQSQTVAVTSS